MVTNRTMAEATTVSASSSQSAAPAAWIKDQLRSKAWRSEEGWNVVSGFNDRLDFSDGTTRAASLTAGNYATGDAMAAHIQTQMNAVSSTCVVTYSSSTKKFTISRTGTLSLLWSTGTNASRSIGACLGFDTSANDTGSSSYTGDTVAYKSREWIKVDLGSALSVQAGVVINHNLETDGTITLQGNASDSWGSPTVDQALSGDGDIRAAYISTQTLRYWRLLIDGVENDATYTEVGVWYAGPYVEPTVCYSVGLRKNYEQLSDVLVGISGAHFQDERPQRPVWSMRWNELESADRVALHDALYAVPRGAAFFFGFDDTDATDTEYVWLADGFGEELTTHLYHDIPVPVLAGALG